MLFKTILQFKHHLDIHMHTQVRKDLYNEKLTISKQKTTTNYSISKQTPLIHTNNGLTKKTKHKCKNKDNKTERPETTQPGVEVKLAAIIKRLHEGYRHSQLTSVTASLFELSDSTLRLYATALLSLAISSTVPKPVS